MDLKELVCVKENFFDTASLNKFLKFVKNDMNYKDQEIFKANETITETIDLNKKVRKTEGDWLNNNMQMIPSKEEPFAMTKVFWYNFLVCKFSNFLHEFYDNNNMRLRPHDYDMDIQVLKYEDSGHYVPHIDYTKHAPRHFSFSYILNDDYEGGEIEFHFPKNEVLKVKPKANSCIMFPSNFAFTHGVNPVTKGTRYVVVGWMP